MITCRVCGREMRALTNTHLRSHGLTPSEYAARYGELTSDEVRRTKNHFKGDWNQVGLGEVPDSVLAVALGVNRKAVERERHRRGIPAFVGLILRQDGLPCRSVYEAMYDAYLHWQGIDHEHEVVVHALPYVADLQVAAGYVEIAGMCGFSRYDKKLSAKREAYERAGLSVTWLSPADVQARYSDCPVRVQFRVQRYCSACGAENRDLVKGLCRRTCYMAHWRQAVSIKGNCAQCGAEFRVHSGLRGRFCSHACYAKSMEFAWPSWDSINEQLETTSIRQLALRLGASETALHMRIYRHRKRSGVDVAPNARKQHRWSEEDIAVLQREYGHRPAKEIASILGLRPSLIYNAAAHFGLTTKRISRG